MRDFKNDIEKYLRGELTPAEMHALERKALNDPFLADALEGAQLSGVENFQADIASLQASLQNRLHSKSGKVVSLWIWPMRIAAGLLVLAASTFIIYSLVEQNQSSNKIAQVEKAPAAAEEKSATAADSTTTNTNAVAGDVHDDDQELLSMAKPEEPKPSSVRSHVVTKPHPAETKVSESEIRTLQDAQLAGEVEVEKDEVKKEAPPLSGYVNVDKVAAKSEPVTEAAEQSPTYAYTPEKKVAADDNAKPKAIAGAPAESRARDVSAVATTTIRGKVTSAEDGTGLPGVNVIVIGTNTGTVTDMEGNYHLTVETPNPELSFSFIGLESTEVEVGDEKEIDVAMNLDVSQLSEVVVVGYGAENKTEEEIPTMEFAAPIGGRAAFKKYLEQSLRYPEQALENKIEGKVTVQFTVETTGKLTNFKVIKGLGYGCDEEVIRLIKKGPKWAATKRDDEPVQDKVKVRMRFRLPKK